MNELDSLRFKRLEDIFDRNFRLTRLFAEYLERYPEVISADMVEALTEGGETTREEALVALLSEIFALDFADGEDRRFIMDYLTPAVRLLDAQKYRDNPYYKNIKLEGVCEGDWEIRWEEYAPYRAVICDDMIIREDFSEIAPLGFFTETFRFPAVLEGGNEWMTLTPVDLDTSEEAIERAHGRVLTFGLGLGYYAYMVSEKESVSEVVVVEKSPEVISLFKKHILPQMAHRDKIKIVEMDAFKYAEEVMPMEEFDLAFVDTWRDASDGAPMYERMRALERLSPRTEFCYWIENFLISRLRGVKFIDIATSLRTGAADAPKSYGEVVEILSKI